MVNILLQEKKTSKSVFKYGLKEVHIDIMGEKGVSEHFFVT